MSRLISLYPAAWRARYEAELRDALSYRPLTLRGRFDLVRGALDARLHPELAGSPVGAPVPVGPDTGGGLSATQRAFPWTVFLATTAAVAFAASAMLALFDSRIIGGAPFQGALVATAAVSLGGAAWRMRPERTLRWVVLAILTGATLFLLTLRWPSVGFKAVTLLVIGTLIVGAWGLIAGSRTRRWQLAAGGLGLLLLAVALGYSFLFDIVRGVSVSFVAYALLALRLAAPGLPGRRAATGILGGVILVGVVSAVSIATSPWHTWDGYPLACGEGLQARCTDIADSLAARVRAEHAGALITHMEVFADTRAELCWTAPLNEDRGCWHTDRQGS